MKHILKALVIILCIVFFVGGGTWMIYSRAFKSIEFEQVYEKDADFEIKKREVGGWWFTLRSSEYHGVYGEGSLNTLGVKNNDDIVFDYDHYTYIVTIGHELINIEYSRSDMKNRIYGIFPKQYVGHVTLKEDLTDKVYIYRIKKKM